MAYSIVSGVYYYYSNTNLIDYSGDSFSFEGILDSSDPVYGFYAGNLRPGDVIPEVNGYGYFLFNYILGENLYGNETPIWDVIDYFDVETSKYYVDFSECMVGCNGNELSALYGRVSEGGKTYEYNLSKSVEIPANVITFSGNLSGSGNEDSNVEGQISFSAVQPSYQVASQSKHGTASIDSDSGKWLYAPFNDFYGSDSFIVAAKNTTGTVYEQPINITIEPLNDPGHFTGDLSVKTDSKSAASGSIQFGDNSDGFSKPNYEIAQNPKNGTATVNSTNGEWTYEPNTGFKGSDSFLVSVTDDSGYTESQSIEIDVSDLDAPGLFQGDLNGIGLEDSKINGQITFTDVIDGNSDPAFYISQAPNHGMAFINADSGQWSYKSEQDFNGLDQFIVSATDDSGNIEKTTLQMQVSSVNDPGIFTGDVSGKGKRTQLIQGLLKFIDPADGVVNPRFLIHSDPENGVASIDSSTGAWTYKSSEAFTGRDSFRISAFDADGHEEFQTLAIRVTGKKAQEQVSERVPELVSAKIKGKRLTLQFNEQLATTIPALSKFTLRNGAREVALVDISMKSDDGLVVLTTETTFDSSARLKLDYLDLNSDQQAGVLESLDGVDLPSFSGFAVSNQSIDKDGAQIDYGEFDGDTISLFFDRSLRNSVPSRRRFKVKAGKKTLDIDSVDLEADDGVVNLRAKRDLSAYESLKVTYKDLKGDQSWGVIEDESGNDVKTFENFLLENPNYDDTPPVLTEAELEDDFIRLDFDSILEFGKLKKSLFKLRHNGRKLKVVSASIEDFESTVVKVEIPSKRASSISLGDSLIFSYKDPSSDQSKGVIQDLAGNDFLTTKGVEVDIF